MALLDSITADKAQDLIDAQVVDQTGSEIGTVHSLWADPQTGKLQFLGVKTGWLFGQNHVIPIDRVEMNSSDRSVRVPYTADFVKGALSIDADSEISDEQEAEIYSYYKVGGRTTTATAGYTDAETTRTETRTADVGNTANLAASSNTARATTSDKDTIEVPLSEEELKVGKRTVSAGQVRLRKIVRTEIVNKPVEIRHEDVVVERIPASEIKAGTATSNFEEQTIDVPLSREEVVMSKESHVTGAVRVNKTAMTETQNVSDSVRKEDVEVLRDGKAVVEERDARK